MHIATSNEYLKFRYFKFWLIVIYLQDSQKFFWLFWRHGSVPFHQRRKLFQVQMLKFPAPQSKKKLMNFHIFSVTPSIAPLPPIQTRDVRAGWAAWEIVHPLFYWPLLKRDICKPNLLSIEIIFGLSHPLWRSSQHPIQCNR